MLVATYFCEFDIFGYIYFCEFDIFYKKSVHLATVNLDFLSETCVNQNQKGILKGIKELIRSVLKYILQNKSILGE